MSTEKATHIAIRVTSESNGSHTTVSEFFLKLISGILNSLAGCLYGINAYTCSPAGISMKLGTGNFKQD